MPDIQPQKSRRDSHLERLRKNYPDKKFEDDEEIFGQIEDDYNSYDSRIDDYEKERKSFSSLFTKDPRSARLLMDWKNGGDPAVSFLRIFGKDFADAAQDPTRIEEFAKANKEFSDRVAKEKQYEQEYEQNLQASLQEIENSGIDDDTLNKVMEKYAQLAVDFVMGKITADAIKLIQNSLNYDRDIQMADAQGQIAGRNQRIEEQLKQRRKGDGIAPLDGKGIEPQKPINKHKNIFDTAAEAY